LEEKVKKLQMALVQLMDAPVDVGMLKEKLDNVGERLQRCEETKADAREGLRRRMRLCEKRMEELEMCVKVVEQDLGGMEEEVRDYDDDVERVGHSEKLYEGAYVVVHGVQSRMELNGMMGLMVEFREDKTRWIVRLHTEESVLLKAENLRADG
jgi:hypothetical protein